MWHLKGERELASVLSFEIDGPTTTGAPVQPGDLLSRAALAAARLRPEAFIEFVCRLVADALPIESCVITPGPGAVPLPGALGLPLVCHGRPVGVMSLTGSGDFIPVSAGQWAEVEAIAALVAVVVAGAEAIAVERDRIGRDLHDSVGQSITGLGLRLASQLDDVEDEAASWLRGLLELVEQANRELREAIHGMLRLEKPSGGLVEAINALCLDFERRTGVAVQFSVRGRGAVPVRESTHEAILRVALEALRNIERHARASRVTVGLVHRDGAVTLLVSDDGVGIDRPSSLTRLGRFGVRTMQRRIEELGGHLYVRQATPHGVVVEAVIYDKERSAYAISPGGSGG
jgi:signal transduction histidine kinase